ncbi:hypothetical protein VPHK225_0045 [Vibrio phage K225]|nr:hypothetical protein PODOV044v1_p0041 [Vibrio phage 23E28.1]QZI92049.1 hypothetical protein PODOV045v1_p0007 [Vibrio phage 69E27.1]
MQNYETRPFDLEEALAGAQLVTQSGYKARLIDDTRKADDGRSLVVLLKVATGEELRSYHRDGTCSTPSKSLLMYEPVTGGWFNIYEDRKVDPTIYGSKKQANDAALANRVALVHTTWKDSQ